MVRNRRVAGGVVLRVKLKVRVVRYCCQGEACWYADIDDADDRQPDDPYWFVDGCRSQHAALDQACARLVELERAVAAGRTLHRVSGALAA